ncbi:MCE family protein [Rhodococcus sp. X156]|uniref:MCE family protein n=1 Tax=Rhodococcus sp. X156 TaxID=2499145 RepID=UPI000FD9D6EF|nr:MCE family protein [Rhodococcus sp. X156]
MRTGTSWGRQLLGLLFVLLIVGGLVLTVLIYQKKFVSVVRVTMTADSVGNQLLPEADVKLNGLIVGEVREITTADGRAELTLALQPDKAELIPNNVTARFLPKTLFGDKYVSLVMPAAQAEPISGGDVIRQDTTQETVEIQRVLDGLLPVLRAVPPAELNSTLGAVAQALDGRGQQLGQNLSQLNTLVTSLNRELPALQADISGLADFADTYTAAAPDLLQALANLTTTTNTVVDQRNNLDLLYSTVTATSANLTGFLNANGANIIRLSNDSVETLELLARFSPQYPCVFDQFARLVPNIDGTLGKGSARPGLNLKLEITKSRGKYVPGRDEPNITDDRGPACYPIVDPAVGNFPQYPGGPVQDGAYKPPSTNADFQASSLPTDSAGLGVAGSVSEQELLATIFAQANGTDPAEVPGWSALVGAPALRGNEVTIK